MPCAGTRGGGNTTYSFCLLAQFKNEEAILTEWINHYLREGVEHLFLLDDGSDDASQRLLRPYVTKGLATVLRDVRKDRNPPASMIERYNLLFKPHLHSCTWFAHVDLVSAQGLSWPEQTSCMLYICFPREGCVSSCTCFRLT